MKTIIAIVVALSGAVTPVLAAVESEPNNTPEQANGTVFGVTTFGQLATATDQDWFSLIAAHEMPRIFGPVVGLAFVC